SPFISALSYDNEIYVNPFVFGVIRGDDGEVISNISDEDILTPEMKVSSANGFIKKSDLDLTIRGNLLIFKLPFYQKTNNNSLNKYTFIYSTFEYPSKNVNILFKLKLN
ncbi:MAG: hypothetical protein PHX47_04235, partial [Candidatus ainarchaeum sp.]|nr:hypothetical protein [Candidatus ainarchaeum sp.]